MTAAAAPKRKRSTLGAQLRARGFDESYYRRPYWHPRCSQCEALVINGQAAHETGCPRIPRDDDDD